MADGLTGRSTLVSGGHEVETYAPIATQAGASRSTLLYNGATPADNLLSLDGSGTPVTISAGPTGETWYDVELVVAHFGSGGFGSTKFGGCSENATNGPQVKVNGTAIAPFGFAENAHADMMGRNDVRSDCVIWRIPIAGIVTDGQKIEVVVSDNLTALAGGTASVPLLRYRVHA